MWPDLAFLNSGVLVAFGVVLTFLATRYFANRKLIETARTEVVAANTERDSRIVELEKQIALMTAAVVPISTAFQAILIKELTHFHTPELDKLLEKIGPPIVLTPPEERRMSELLREREVVLDGEISETERDAARMLPMVMKRVRLETESLQPVEALQLVGLPPQSVKPE